MRKWIRAAVMLFALMGIMGMARSEAEQPMKFAVGRQMVWTVDGSDVFASMEGSEQSVLVTQVKGIQLLACQQNEAVYMTMEGDTPVLTMIDDDNVVFYREKLPQGMKVRKIVSANDITTLYILGSVNGSRDKIYRFNPYMPQQLDNLVVRGWDGQGITDIARWENLLYTYSSATRKLSVIDLDTMTMLNELILLDDVKDMTPADSIKGVPHMYIQKASGQGKIDLVNLQTGITVAEVDVPQNCQGLERSLNELYMLNEAGDQLLTFSMPVLEDTKRLVIVNGLDTSIKRMKTAVKMFHDKYPDVDVKSLWIDDVFIEKDQISVGLEGIDILNVQEQVTRVSTIEMYKAGAIEELSQYEEIANAISGCLDMFAPVSWEGQLFGISTHENLYGWKINAELAAEVGISIPEEGWTWDEFFAMAEQVEAYNQANGKHVKLLNDPDERMPYFLAQYNANTIDIMAGTANYTNPRFIELLEKWKDLHKSGLVSYFDENITKINSVFTIEYWMNYYSLFDVQHQPVFPPVIDESTRYPVNTFRMVVNSNSPYKEEAVYFLACYMSPEAMLTDELSGHMLKNVKDYPEYQEYRFSALIKEEYVDIWRKMLANSVQDYFVGELHREQLWTLCPALYAEDITAEEFGKACQEKADMALGE